MNDNAAPGRQPEWRGAEENYMSTIAQGGSDVKPEPLSMAAQALAAELLATTLPPVALVDRCLDALRYAERASVQAAHLTGLGEGILAAGAALRTVGHGDGYEADQALRDTADATDELAALEELLRLDPAAGMALDGELRLCLTASSEVWRVVHQEHAQRPAMAVMMACRKRLAEQRITVRLARHRARPVAGLVEDYDPQPAAVDYDLDEAVV